MQHKFDLKYLSLDLITNDILGHNSHHTYGCLKFNYGMFRNHYAKILGLRCEDNLFNYHTRSGVCINRCLSTSSWERNVWFLIIMNVTASYYEKLCRYGCNCERFAIWELLRWYEPLLNIIVEFMRILRGLSEKNDPHHGNERGCHLLSILWRILLVDNFHKTHKTLLCGY